MSNKVHYAANPSGVLANSEAELVGRELVRIEKKHGAILPEKVVDEARPDQAKLHPYFTWDDEKAAELYRRDEARGLIRSVVIIRPDTEDEEPEPIRAFVNVHSKEDEKSFEGKAYISIGRAMNDDSYKQQVVEKAYQELVSWKRRYENLKQFSQVFNAIEAVAP
jgi:hypothetical protein